LTSREDIKGLRNKELQEAKVQEEVPELADLEEMIDSVIDDLDLMIDIVKEKKEELDKANTNLSRQQKVVESMIGLGYSVKYREGE
jgi:t-SNARE complex subunit (syntaxin)